MIHRFRNFGIFTKITILTVIVVLFCSFISSAILLNQFTVSMKEKDKLLVQEAASKIATFLKDKYNMVYNQRTLIHSTGYIADTIVATRPNPSDIYKPEHLTKITEYLAALCYSDENIKDAVLFTADGKNTFSYSLASDRKIDIGYDYLALPCIQLFSESEHAITAVYNRDLQYLTMIPTQQSKEAVSFIVKISDLRFPTKPVTVGYLIINYSPSDIDSAYSQIVAASEGEYYAINADNDIIYTNIPSSRNKKYTEKAVENYNIILDKPIGLSGIRVIGSVSDEVLQKHISLILYQGALITGIGILLMIAAIMILHKFYTRKFRQLANAMDKMSGGDFNIKLPVTSQDEIGFLSQTFNTMCDTLDEHIKKTYLAETQRRTAELYALQSQINPHFLANTIESIRMKALSDGNYEVSEMLSNLGSLFSWMIQFHQDIVYVDDEVEYIESYLELQKFRFGEKVMVDIEVPSDAYYLGIPKFTLQPIVENAITHGAASTGSPLTISIQFQIIEDQLNIIIKDDGLGINEDQLKKLTDHVYGRETYSEFGVALRNVHARIQLLFGDSYGLQIKSVCNQGTTVITTLPATEKKEMEQDVQNDHR